MRLTLGLVTAMILAVLWPAALVDPAAAQEARASVELKRVVGRVEMLRAGQNQWLPAVVGARLVEGDDIRAFSGASAELVFPDMSTVFLAENSRLLMTKLEFDQQQQSRVVLLHLAVGKLRAVVAQTAITLARAQQSNFAITTSTAVAAAKGTVVWVFSDGQKVLFAVEAEPNLRFQPRIECIPLAGTTEKRRRMILAGTVTADCNPAQLISPQFLTLSNPATAGSSLVIGGGTGPSTASVLALINSTGPGSTEGVGLSTINPPPVGLPGPSSLGVNAEVFAAPVCSSAPCN